MKFREVGMGGNATLLLLKAKDRKICRKIWRAEEEVVFSEGEQSDCGLHCGHENGTNWGT
jgi:hypothetical protein